MRLRPPTANVEAVESDGIKHRLLAAVAAAREREHELLALCDDAPPPEPGLWTVKDHLAHLNEWRRYAAGVLDAGRTGSEPPNLGEEIDTANARIYEDNKDKTADEVKSEVRASNDKLAAAIATCTDEVFELIRLHRICANSFRWDCKLCRWAMPGDCSSEKVIEGAINLLLKSYGKKP